MRVGDQWKMGNDDDDDDDDADSDFGGKYKKDIYIYYTNSLE